MGGLWRANGGPFTAAEFEIKAETVDSPWWMAKFRTEIWNEALGDITEGRQQEKTS